MTIVTTDANATVLPPGYSEDDVEQCKALTDLFVSNLQGVKGHVAMSAVLTTYNGLVEGYPPDARFRAGQHLITVGAGIANAGIDAGAMTNGAEKSATVIAQQISNLLATERHGQGLDALLMVFKVLALKFPCCTEIAANNAARVAQELATAAALTVPPGAANLH